MALAAAELSPTLLGYLVHGRDDGLPGFEQPGTPGQQAAKRQALAAYASQLALSGGRLRGLAERAECHARIEPAPSGLTRTLPWRPSPLLWPRLRLTVASTSGLAQQWPWSAAPLRRDGQGGWRLEWSAARAEDACFVRLSLALPSPWIFDHWGWREV